MWVKESGMQFYDLFKDIIAYIPERYTLLNSFVSAFLPFVLMACALLTAFLGLKCIKWWCMLTFFFFGTGLSAKYLIDGVDFYNVRFWVTVGICLAVGIVCAVFSMYLARVQLACSEFLIVYAALPPLILSAGEIPAKIISAAVALAIVFLTVRYKYLVILPTTAFSGSFIFWEVAVRYTDIGNEKLNGIIMGIVALAFQCYISSEQIKNTYEDVKRKVKKTEKGGEMAVHYVERKIHTKDLHLKNIKFKGIRNARDLGGIPVEGGVIKPKKLIRSGHLCNIKKSDEEKLKNEYNLKAVIDLRNTTEKSEKPDKQIEDVTLLEMPVFDKSIPGISHDTKKDLDNVPAMTKLYAAVMNGGSFKNLCNTVRNIVHLCDKDYTVLFHCTEGKDRTGMVTAILLIILGTERDVIVEDYLFTNTLNRRKAITYYLLVLLLKWNKKAAHLVYDVFLAREDYINEVFKKIDEIGREEFIENYLNLSEYDIENFRSHVVEPNE